MFLKKVLDLESKILYMYSQKIKIVSLLLLSLFVISCSSGEEKPDDNVIKSISMETESNQKAVIVGNSIAFSAKNQEGKDITHKVDFFVDDVKITGASYTFAKRKNYIVYSKYKDVTSSKLTIKSIEPTHTTKVLLEDYTATWCGYCPEMAYKIEQVVKEKENVIAVAIHNDQNFPFKGVKTLVNTLGIPGYPTGTINRIYRWNEWFNSPEQVYHYLSEKKNLGLAIKSSLSEEELTVKVKVHYDVKSKGQNKLVVYLVENGLIAAQANYYNENPSSHWYQKGNPLEDFEHNHVARIVLTNVLGDIIPNDKNATGSTYEKDFKVVLPNYIKDKSKLQIVAFVVDTSRKAINVQQAKVGEDKDFD